MRVDNVVSHPPRLSEHLQSAFQIIQLGAVSENIDDVDRMTTLAQRLCLLPHESPITWPLRMGIHVRHKEDSHDFALPSLKASPTGTSLRICYGKLVKLDGLFDHSR